MRKKILVDMDGVLADLEGRFLEVWRESHPDKVYVPLEQRTTFFLEDQYPSEYRPLIEGILFGKDFFRSFKPIEGGFSALNEMLDMGHDVSICTAPLPPNHYCIPEKKEWIVQYMGEQWLERAVFELDKTLVDGDYLIDDKPNVGGKRQPAWEHILYTTPRNVNVDGKRRLTWADWKEVLNL